jgi:hypothetical protein
MQSRAPAIACVLALAACGSPPRPESGRDVPEGPRVERVLDPTDVFPADLDVVVRVDVGRMRSDIGQAAADELSRRAFADPSEEELRQALGCAEVVWIATRAADIDAGDRVVVVEGRSCMPDLLAARWKQVRSANGKLRIFDRTAEAPRSGTARIMNLGNRATAFVSSVELDSVRRVIVAGPDPKRGNPTAEGLVSFDLRVGRLPPALEKKYPSIGAVLAGVERVRGSARLVDEGMTIDAQVVGATAAGAERAARFLEALRDSLAETPRFAAAAHEARVEQVEKTVQVRVTVPAKAVLALVTEEEKK